MGLPFVRRSVPEGETRGVHGWVTIWSEECVSKRVNRGTPEMVLLSGRRGVLPGESKEIHGSGIIIWSTECAPRGVIKSTRKECPQ